MDGLGGFSGGGAMRSWEPTPLELSEAPLEVGAAEPWLRAVEGALGALEEKMNDSGKADHVAIRDFAVRCRRDEEAAAGPVNKTWLAASAFYGRPATLEGFTELLNEGPFFTDLSSRVLKPPAETDWHSLLDDLAPEEVAAARAPGSLVAATVLELLLLARAVQPVVARLRADNLGASDNKA